VSEMHNNRRNIIVQNIARKHLIIMQNRVNMCVPQKGTD
jgi:hypothetical protein